LPPDPDQAAKAAGRIRAILFICAAFFCFSLLDATAKWLSPRIGTVETAWVRYLSAFLITSMFLNPWRVPGITATSRPGLQVIRSLLLLASTVLNFLALNYLQLAETVSIMFLQPLLVALVAGPLLGEWAGPRRLIAIGVGFIGVLLVTRPGLGGIHWAAVFSFSSVVMYAAFALITRFLARDDSSETTMFYSSLGGLVMLTPAIPFLWKAEIDGMMLFLMVTIGFWGALGHWLLILAHRLAPAPVLAPFLYTQIIWMVSLGFIVFGDVPDRWTLIGGCIVIGSGLYLLHRERVRATESH
jgi:drug/metabolite transporter (DMT)-like permease